MDDRRHPHAQKGYTMSQFTMQELKWLDQVLRRDIENTKTKLPSLAEKPVYEAIVLLDISNKEALRAKIYQTVERTQKRTARQR